MEEFGKGVLRYVVGVEANYIEQDDVYDFSINIDLDMFKDPEFAIYNAEVFEDGEYMRIRRDGKDIYSFFYGDPIAGKKLSWMWAICSNHVSSRTKRKKLGAFKLYDQDTLMKLPNTKGYRDLREALKPYIEAEFEKIKKEGN